MSLLIYAPLFWVFAIISIYLQDRASSGEKKVSSLTTVIKALPELIAVIWVITFRLPTLFTILLVVALVFCIFGDVAMEADIVRGIGMFLIAHIFYTANFLWQASIIGPAILPLTLSILCMGVMVVYVFMLIRSLRASGPEVPPFILKAGSLYFLLISATFSTSLLLWLASGTFLGFVPVIGAIFFVISDSLIGINEFHHKISRHELCIMPTYYLATFLLSLGVLVFLF